MKRVIHYIAATGLCLLILSQTHAQQNSITIGSETLNDKAVLWLVSNSSGQGLLLPVVSSSTRTSGNMGLNADDEGMLVYDSGDKKIYYWTGSSWTALGGVSGGVNPDNVTIGLNGSSQLEVRNLGISDAKVATGISGSKIVPNFGSQNIVTTGALSVGNSTTFNTRSYTWSNAVAPANSFLRNDGSGNLSWQTLSNGVDQTTKTGVLIGNGTAVNGLAATAASQYLRRNSANTNYEFASLTATDIPALDASKITTGTFPLTRINGAGASVRAILGSDNNTLGWITGTPDQLLGTDNTGALKFLDKSNFSFTSANIIPKGSSGGLIASQLFDDGANIGIGTTTPAYLVDISKTLSGASDTHIRTINPSATTSAKSGIRFQTGGGWAVQLQTSNGNNWLELTNNSGIPYHIWTADSYYPGNGAAYLQGTGGNLALMGGNVGIGTASPSSNLTISGGSTSTAQVTAYNASISSFAFASSSLSLSSGTGAIASTDWKINGTTGGALIIGTQNISGMLWFSKNGSATAVLSNTHFGPYSDSQLDLGTSSFRWNRLYYTSGVLGTSDRRLKENILPLQYGLQQVLQLKPVSFTWKKLPEQGTQLGLIAQDVRQVIPEIVIEADNADKTLALNHLQLIPVLVNAIQEQQKTIEGLQEKLSAVENEHVQTIEELKREVDEIKRMLQTEASVKTTR